MTVLVIPYSFRRAWLEMKRRCDVVESCNYHRYGEKGITYCFAWEDFWHFYSDMWPSWQQGLILDRIDNNLGYCKSNCRWATDTESSRNRDYVKLTVVKANEIRELWAAGKFSYTSLARKYGVHRQTIWNVVNGRSWK